MPVDIAGNRADVVCFAKSSVSRMNPGQFYEQYIGAASRDLSKWIKENYGILEFNVIWDRLMAYYKAASPFQWDLILNNYITDEEKDGHLKTVVADGIYLFIPADSDHLNPSIKREIEKVIVPTYGPVTYKNQGEYVTTEDNVFIGVHQMIVLEKTDQHPMAVSSGVLQHHGLLAGSSKISRTGHPSKVQTVKAVSETELRAYGTTMGPTGVAELMTMNNSPETHKAIANKIVSELKPTALYRLDPIKPGSSRPLMFINHILTCAGSRIANYKVNKPTEGDTL